MTPLYTTFCFNTTCSLLSLARVLSAPAYPSFAILLSYLRQLSLACVVSAPAYLTLSP
jgi:hypothetical protein